MKKLWILGTLALVPLALPTAARADKRQERVADRVEKRLENAPALRGFSFNVQTVGRYLDLRGRVRTEAQRRRAGFLARREAPRFPVRNFIVVDPTARR